MSSSQRAARLQQPRHPRAWIAALVSVVLLASLIIFAGGARSDIPGITVRASVSSSEQEGDRLSAQPAISASGLHTAFVSEASNLVPGDTNGVADAFVRDAVLGTTVRVSVGTKGEQADLGVRNPAISADGRFVAFETNATTLGPTDQASKIFVRDRDTDRDGVFDETSAARTVLLSVDNNGRRLGSDTRDPTISADGRFVTFESQPASLPTDILVRDRDADGDGRFDEGGAGAATTQLLSRPAFDDRGRGDGDSVDPALSADGRFVIFESIATNLIGRDEDDDTFCDGGCDGNGDRDIFVSSVQGGPIELLSRRAAGTLGDCGGAVDETCNTAAAVSADGRFVTFSSADTLVPSDGNTAPNDDEPGRDVYVRDRDADRDGIFDEGNGTAVFIASLENDGQAANGRSLKPSISADGRYVAFESLASDLVKDSQEEEDTNRARDIFVRDVVAGRTTRVSVDSEGDETFPRTSSENASISSTGRYVAFDSDDEALVGLFGDNNDVRDVFVRDRLPAVVLDPVPVTFPSRTLRTISDATLVTLTNEGSGPLEVARVRLTAGSRRDFSISANSCSGRRLHSDDECSVGVRFRPTLPGPRLSLLAFEFDDRRFDQSVLLVGAGNTPVLTVNPALGRPGAVTLVTGVDFPASTRIVVKWDPGIGRVRTLADATGNLQFNMLLMHNETIGPRELVARGGRVRVTTNYLVVPGTAQPGGFVNRR